MEKKRVITISGVPGAGKSSTADRVADVLGYRRFSSGDFMRSIAKTHDVSLDDMNRMAETDTRYDHEVDEMVREVGEKDDVVIDSRLAFHWIPKSFKVFLTVDPRVAAERTLADIRKAKRVQQTDESLEDVYRNLVARIASENTRYRTLYGVSYDDESAFDLVIDTAQTPLEDVVTQVVEAYQEWLTQ